ncbi:MAG TPA: flagellar motor protein MotD [Steroidobacteraceae bacterium]|nr:flagellar motor protein MotD [Steroidobacteraceae bacterium]
MARRRRHKHEDHQNHEAWAIPYGDLITLLLAFFVVMYAISTVNEGKYRVLSDSLFAAFRGTPRTMEPVQVGDKQVGSGADIKTSIVQQAVLQGQPRSLLAPLPVKADDARPFLRPTAAEQRELAHAAAVARSLDRVADEVVRATDELVRANLVFVRRKSDRIEVEIRTDILFPSGSATLSAGAQEVITRLAVALRPFPNPIRVEGHTDSRPIRTIAFPSNWELSAARAASVVHRFAETGIDPARLSVIGYGQFKPAQPNTSVEGRNANRRVVIVVLSTDAPTDDGATQAAAGGAAPQAQAAPDGGGALSTPAPATTDAAITHPAPPPSVDGTSTHPAGLASPAITTLGTSTH